jgi:hypothetical protein
MSTSCDHRGCNASAPTTATTSTTSSTSERRETVAHYAVQFAVVVVLSMAIAVGNILLIATVCRSKQLRSAVGNALIFNLGLVDLVSAVVVLPLFGATIVTGAPPGGQPGCTAVAFVTQTVFTESIVTLAAVGADRYLSICHPLQYPRLVTERGMAVVIGKWFQMSFLRCGFFVNYGQSMQSIGYRLQLCNVRYGEVRASSRSDPQLDQGTFKNKTGGNVAFGFSGQCFTASAEILNKKRNNVIARP